MSVKICKGCIHWVRTEDAMADTIWYCNLFYEWKLKYRILFCNGKYKQLKTKSDNTRRTSRKKFDNS